MMRVKRTYASGARPIGAPGWPEFAFSTASIDSVRIVFIASSSSARVSVVVVTGPLPSWLPGQYPPSWGQDPPSAPERRAVRPRSAPPLLLPGPTGSEPDLREQA